MDVSLLFFDKIQELTWLRDARSALQNYIYCIPFSGKGQPFFWKKYKNSALETCRIGIYDKIL